METSCCSEHERGKPDQDFDGRRRDVFINLCDGTPDEPVAGIKLVKAMEKLGAAFTGGDSSFFDPTRQEMKRVAARVGVPTPASTFAKSMADVERASR